MPITTVGSNSIDGLTTNYISETTPIKENMVLATINYSREGEAMSPPSKDFYTDVQSNINEIKDYDLVYLLRANFSK